MAAQDAELKLKVSLDLAFFRAQLSRLPIEAAGYSVPIGIKLDNKSIAAEFRRLSKYLGQKKYRIDITDTAVSAAADKVEKLSDKLKALSAKIQIDIGAGISKDVGTAAKVMAQKLASQFQGDIGAAARAMQQMRPAAGPYGKGTMSVPGFREAAQGMGIENAFKLFFQELKQADPKRLAKVLDDGSTMMMRENADIKTGLDAIQNKAQKLASDLSAMGDAARMGGKAFIKEGEKTLYPQNYGLKIASLLSSVEKLNNDLRRVSVEGGVELLDALKDLSFTLREASNSFVQIAGLNSTLDDTLRGFDAASKKASQATNAYADRINRRAGLGPAQLGVGTGRFAGTEVSGALAKRPEVYDPYKIIEVQVKNAFDIIEDFHKRRLEDFTSGYQKIIDEYYKNILVQPAQIRGVSPFNLPPRQLALPPAGQTSAGQTRFNAVTTGGRGGGGGGYVPPTGFPSDGPDGGKQGPATFIGAGSSMEKFKTGMDVASASMKNFRASQIPLIGSLKEIASEFGFALKQVLLFGTAYKGLAFIQSLPGQVLNAAKSQQQFNNALQTATQDTGTFAKELLYVDNVQRAFGLNLETTRSGFVRLYASMAPTGFDSGSIEKLFTGISAATAALQLTPDKAERVIYAFGQMASKGQIMSEELKGQLGDVLPGALAIFAKSAGMSVKEFSKAMEDGEFVGSRFREVFAKVSDELMNRFGTGAQAAGRSLQGLLNTVQGDFQRTLESFSPLANIAAQAILGPLSQSLNQLSKAASLAFGEQERLKKQLADAKAIKDNEQNVAALEARLEALNATASDPAISQQVKNIEDFVSQVSAAAKNVANFAGTIGSVLGPILTLFGTNLNSIIGSLTLLIIGFNGAKIAAMAAMAVMVTMNTVEGMSRGAAVGVNVLAGAFRLLGVSATGAQIATIGFGTAVKGLLASTGVGLLVVALGSIATAFMDIGNKASRAAERTKSAMSAMQDAIRSGNVEIARAQLADTQRLRNEVEDAVKLIDKLRQKGRKTGRGGSDVYAKASLAERMQLEQAGYDVQLQGRGEVRITFLENQTAGLRAELANLEQRQRAGVALAEKRKQDIGLDQPKPTKPGARIEQDDNTVKEKRKYVSQLSELLRQELDNKLLAIDQNALLNDRMREIQKAAATYDSEMLIAEAEYNEKISAEKTKNIANLTQYLKESKRLYDLEKAQIQSRYEGVVTKPLRDMLNADIADQEKLKASVKSLSEGKDEQTRVEERQVQIKNALSGLDEESIKQLKPLIDRILKEAAAVDRLTEAQKAANKAKEERQRLDEGIKNTIANLREEIALLRAASEEERKRLRIRQENKGISKEKEDEIYRLEKVRDNIKATRELIDNFVDDTSRDYKGFLKAVISGEDAADALQQFQEGLADRVLTIFLDFSMKPVEDFFKDVMGGEIIEKLFPRDKLKEGELPKATSTDPVKAANDNTNATNANTTAINDLTNKLTTQASQATAPGGGASGYFNTNILSSGLQSAMQGMNTGVGFGAGGSFAGSAAFSQELSSISTGLQNATPSLTGFSQAVNGFSNTAVDTAVQTAEAAKTAQQSGAEFAQGLGKAVQGIGIAVSSVMTIMAGIQQMNKGGTKNTLAGIGSILLGLGSGLGGFLKLGKAANGAVWKGGFQAFANGGTVSGPTLGLIGEGRYNEAIVPLPDGKSIPVALQGGSRSRDLISDRSERSAAPVLNMSFQTTSINGIEYVSKDQLEQAMAQTRRLAAKEGATKGASMAIDKLQQSPSVRRRVGM